MPKTTTDIVRNYWRREFGTCVVCDQEPVDGAHIYGAGAYPHFKNVYANGVALCRRHHRIFDNIRSMDEKLDWLIQLTCGKHAERVKNKLDVLAQVVQEYRNANGGAIR